MNEQEQLVIMQLIMAGGNAKGSSFEAIKAAKVGDFSTAEAKLKEADSFLSDAHNAQTGMLTEEAQGKTSSIIIDGARTGSCYECNHISRLSRGNR